MNSVHSSVNNRHPIDPEEANQRLLDPFIENVDVNRSPKISTETFKTGGTSGDPDLFNIRGTGKKMPEENKGLLSIGEPFD